MTYSWVTGIQTRAGYTTLAKALDIKSAILKVRTFCGASSLLLCSSAILLILPLSAHGLRG